MIDGWAHWPEDPFSGQHDGPGIDGGLHGGLDGGTAGEVYGSVWHDGPDGPHTDGADHGWSGAADGLDSGHGYDPEYGPAGHGDGALEHGPVDGGHGGHGGADQPHPRSGQHDLTGHAHLEPQPAVTAAGDLSGDLVGLHIDVAAFPPRLDLDVSPADGHDWVDVDLLGEPDHGDAFRFASAADLLADLHRSDGADGEASWQAVAGSDDPAVRALGMRWRH